MKALVKAALGPMDVQQAKDVEVCLAGVRADKVKEETAAKAAKKGAGPLCSFSISSLSQLRKPARDPATTVLGPVTLAWLQGHQGAYSNLFVGACSCPARALPVSAAHVISAVADVLCVECSVGQEEDAQCWAFWRIGGAGRLQL